MSIHSFSFNPSLGAIIPVYLAEGTSSKSAVLPKQDGVYHTNALIDTGADTTCIDRNVAKKMNWIASGSDLMSGATGTAEVNSYFLTVGIHMEGVGNFQHTDQIYEYMGGGGEVRGYEVLLGRDIICKGFFQLNFDGRAIFGL